jgi:hypothetical protein
MADIRGKSIQALVRDIADGYVAVNPIFLKGMDNEVLKQLYAQVQKMAAEVRGSPFPHNDMQAIRQRNMRLQRLHGATIVIKNFARTRQIKMV